MTVKTPISAHPFDPLIIGPLVLRDRFIRSAAFEGMSARHAVTPELIAYHKAVAEGGVGITTVAYASVSQSGLSFAHQLWMREEIIPQLEELTRTVHNAGAKVSIQLGHTGNMANKSVTGCRPIAPSGRINVYGPTWPRAMKEEDIQQVIHDFAQAVRIAFRSGFDAVEIHAGHGYLISQFLSPYTNHRKDRYGGSFENRSRFLREVLTACREAAGPDRAILVKMNMSDGFTQGVTHEEALQTAQMIEAYGANAIVLSGGFVSKTPLYIMRGEINPRIMAYHMKGMLVKPFVRWLGKLLMRPLAYEDGYFLKMALPFRDAVKIPLIVVGGMNTPEVIHQALEHGFDGIGLARALIHDPGFVNALKDGLVRRSGCTICNYCVAVMYSGTMRCYLHDEEAPRAMIQIAEKIRYVR